MAAEEHPGLQVFFERLIRRPVLVLMAMLALLAMGLIAASRIPIELQPSGFASSRIWISAPWTGANPQEVEQQILRPIEEELRTIRGVEEIMAFAAQGSGGVIISFPGSMDMDLAYAEVADRVERIRPRLPRDVDRIFIRRWTTADTPIMWLGILYPPEDAENAQDVLADILQSRVEAVDGVANADMHGIEPRSVRIWLDEERVRAAGVDIGGLVRALQQDNLSVPVGDLDDAGSRFIVRVDGRFRDLREIEDFPVRPGLRIADIGRVVMVRSEPEGLFRVNGGYGIGVAVTKETSANAFEVCQRLKTLIEDEFPADPVLGQFGYKIFWNSGETVRESLSGLVQDAALGGFIACIVLMLFLRRLRFTVLIALSIPFSVLVTVTYLYFTGDSFNLFSMMGITISVGMLVDNSVVIVESIFKRREQGEDIVRAVTRGPAEVTLAVVTATLTTVVVFLPLIFMSENRNARTFTTSIGTPLCISLLAALFLAIIIVPVSAMHLTRTAGNRGSLDRLLSRFAPRLPRLDLHRRFRALVGWSLRYRLATILIGLGFILSGFIAAIGNDVSASLAGFGSEIEVNFDLSANTTLAQAEEEVIAIEEVLLGPFRQEIGTPDIGISFSRRSGTMNFWFETDLSQDEEKRFKQSLAERLPQRAAIEYHLENEFDRRNTEDEKWMRLVLEGPETATVARLAERVRDLARDSGDYEEVAEEDDPSREILLHLDREQMQRLGINSQQVLGTVEWTLRGFMVSRLETENADIPIIVEFDEPAKPDRSRLAEMTIAAFGSGASLPLGALSSFEHRHGPRSIFRQNGKTTDVIGLKPKGRDLEENAAKLATMMAGIDLPEGYRWQQAGGWQNFQDDLGELRQALILAIALVFFLMGLLFESLVLPLSVLVTIPFAVAGANWAFRLSGTPVDIIGMIGMIVLAGVVVNNGIVLLDRIIHLRARGLSREESILRGVDDRMRPVMMTALTTICGLLPIALSEPSGNGFSFRGLAIGVAGGLACTTFFTLWMVPLAYSLLDDLRAGLGHRSRWHPFRWRSGRGRATTSPLAGDAGALGADLARRIPS